MLGVVIVTYNSSDVIRDCLDTLLSGAEDVTLRVVVVDNASPDKTIDVIEAWASGEDHYTLPADLPFTTTLFPKPVSSALEPNEGGSLHVIRNEINGGFAAGVNIGLAHLAKFPRIDRFWVLNPDCVVSPGTPGALLRHDPGRFSIMGGRVTYYDRPDMVQMDGGRINRWTGVTSNINLYASIEETSPPDPATIDFITGASMVASREFYEAAGPLPEEYFLYYEEVEWAMRRGHLPLAICPTARIYHKTGTSIGSPTHGRIASPFSLYFKHRARIRFVRRYLGASLFAAWAYTLAKAGQYWLKGWKPEAWAIAKGAWDGTRSIETLGREERDINAGA